MDDSVKSGVDSFAVMLRLVPDMVVLPNSISDKLRTILEFVLVFGLWLVDGSVSELEVEVVKVRWSSRMEDGLAILDIQLKIIRREKEITWHLVFPRNDVVVVAKDRLLSMRTTPLIAKTNQKPHLNEALNA